MRIGLCFAAIACVLLAAPFAMGVIAPMQDGAWEIAPEFLDGLRGRFAW